SSYMQGALSKDAREVHEMAGLDDKLMREAIKQAGTCRPESARDPLVGAVAARNGRILECAYGGEVKRGEHAEFTLLQRKLAGRDLRNVTVFTTLEPCTTRGHLKTPCAYWLIMRQVEKVYIGMLDPNPDIRGLGFRILRDYGIDVEMFTPA